MGSEVSNAGSLSRQKLGHLLNIPQAFGIVRGCRLESVYTHALD